MKPLKKTNAQELPTETLPVQPPKDDQMALNYSPESAAPLNSISSDTPYKNRQAEDVETKPLLPLYPYPVPSPKIVEPATPGKTNTQELPAETLSVYQPNDNKTALDSNSEFTTPLNSTASDTVYKIE